MSALILTFNAPGSLSLVGGRNTPLSGFSLSEPGNLAGETFTADVSDNLGILSAAGIGVSGSGTTRLTITGTLDQVNAALATLADSFSGGTDTLVISAADNLGDSAGPISIPVMPIPPILAVIAPTTATVVRGAPSPITGVSLSEPSAAAGEMFNATLSVAAGILTATGAGVSGSSTANLTINGTLDQVNAALATLTDTEASTGNDLINIAATDSLGNTGRDAITPFAETLSLGILSSQPAHVAAAVATGIPNISLVEPGSVAGEAFTAVVSVGDGIVTATGPGVSGSGTASLTITGTLDQVNAALATLADTETLAGLDTIAITATDSVGDISQRDITVYAMGQALAINAPQEPVVVRGAANAIPGVSLADPGNFTGETFTVTLTDILGALSATGTGVSGSGTQTLTITGTLDQVKAALATLASNAPPIVGTYTISITATDSLGDTVTRPLVPYAVALPLRINAPATPSVSLGAATAIPGVSLSEVGNLPGEDFTVTISTTTGILAATGAGVTGSGSRTLTVNGSLDQVNAALATLSDMTATTGDDAVVFAASDGLGDTAQFNTSFSAPPLNPAIASPLSATVQLGTATIIPGFSLAETGNVPGETFTIYFEISSGTLSATGSGVAGSGTRSLTISGSLAQVNASLATLTATETAAHTDKIAFGATDSLGDISHNLSTAVTTIFPVLTVSAPATLSEVPGTATAIPGVSLSEPGAIAGETFRVIVRATNGVLTDPGGGVIIIGANQQTFSGSLDAVNTALAALVDTIPGGSDLLTYTATDSLGDSAAPVGTTLTVNPHNLVFNAPSSASLISNVATALTGFSLSEPGAMTAEAFTATLFEPAGILAATGAGVTGSGSTTLTISGSLDQVNAALTTLIDTVPAPGSYLYASATDSIGDAFGPISIPVTATTLALTIASPATAAVMTRVATVIPGISLSEPGNLAGETFTATVMASSGLLTATGAGVTGSGSELVTLTGSLTQVNAGLATLADTLATAGTSDITINATDSLGNHAASATTIVNGEALPLAIAAPGSATVTRGSPTVIPGISLTEPGNLPGETFTATVQAATGSLTASGAGVTGSGSQLMTVTGTFTQVNDALATVADTETNAGATDITINATDSLGDTAAPSSVIVNSRALPLSIASPGEVTVTRGVPTLIPGISLSEPGALAGETFTVTVEPVSGMVAATGGAPPVPGSTDLDITGTLDQVNAGLATLTDKEPFVGVTDITIAALDSLGDHATSASIVVDVTPLVIAIAAPATATTTTGVATAIPGVNLSEAGSIAGETFTASLTVANGILTASGTGVSGSGTANLTVTGSLAQVDAALATLSDTESAAGPDTIAIDAADSLGDTAGPVDIAVASLGPSVTAPPTLTLTFGKAAAIPGVSLSDTAAVPGEMYTVTLTDSHGNLSATGGAVQGDATTRLIIPGTLADVNAALATLFDESFSPGSDTITISVTDSQGIKAAPANIAVTTTSPVLPAMGASEEDPARNVQGFGTITDTASGQLGSETSSADVIGGIDPVVTASVIATGSSPPLSYGTASIKIFFEVIGKPFSQVPIIFAGTETTSASPGFFGAEAIVTSPGSLSGTGIVSETLGTGPSGYPASQNFIDKVTVNTNEVYSVTYEAEATGPGPGSGTTGMATATVDPVIAIDPSFAGGSGYTLIADNVPCFLAGTRILTDRGEVPVEALRIGDVVQTVVGETAAPVIWLGRRELDCAHHPQPRKVRPVRISAGAFGPGRPHTDLWLSPDHAIYVRDVLIPVKHLINGTTIAQVPVDRVTYYHIELAEHDVLLAEGLPAESFLDLKDGSNYSNRPGPARLYPDYSARMWEAYGCARLIVTGPELEAARALVAGFAMEREAA